MKTMRQKSLDQPAASASSGRSKAWRVLPWLLLLIVGMPAATQACNQSPPTNTPPTVCVTLLSNCTARIVIKGFSTYTNGPSSQFCSCAFQKVPSILTVNTVEIRVCSSNDPTTCTATGSLLPNFVSNGISSFNASALASTFFASAAGGGQWQGFFSAVNGTIPQNACVDMVFYVTLQSPCSAATLATQLANAGSIVGTSAAQSNGQPNGGHLGLSVAGPMAVGNPTLTIVQSGTQVIISWPNGAQGPGQLQSASSVLGSWSSVSGATSPYTAPSTGTERYYRLVF